MLLENKTALITGAGRGLGRTVAIDMAIQGANVSLISRTGHQIDAVTEKIRSANGAVMTCTGDVSNPDDVDRLVSATVDKFSTIDILVNNAAVVGPANFIHNTGGNDWQKTIAINLNGAYHCTRAVLPFMAANTNPKGGKIINIVSGLGQMPFPRFCAYSVSKAGLIQMTRSLAEELKEKGIQVNAVDPGVMDTDMQTRIRKRGRHRLGDDVFERFVRMNEAGDLKKPDRVSELIVFLACPAADHISGRVGTIKDYIRSDSGYPFSH